MINRIINSLKSRRKSILDGELNCIPFTFPRFSSDVPGIEKDKYYLISGNTKSGKSQITNFMFLYTPILYAYYNPEKVRVKIFYFPLEETSENITLRFMSYLLYTLDKIRIAPIDLKSTNSNKVLTQEVLDLLESDKYQSILKFFENNVIFLSERNPTGVWKVMLKYAERTGTIHTKDISITNKETGLVESRKVFDYYEPNDPKEYVICLIDHISLIEQESGFDLRQSINKLSKYMILLRNKYHYIPVVVQQQSTETNSLEAFKNNKIRPTMAGLSDSKYTGKDCNVLLGITCPYTHELPEYLGYNITKFRGNIRFLEVVLNRDGESNNIVALYFDGATNYFKELPRPHDTKRLESVIAYIEETIRKRANSIFMIVSGHNRKDKGVFKLALNKLITYYNNLFK